MGKISKSRFGIGFTSQYFLTNQLIANGNKKIVLDWMKEIGILYSDVQLKESRFSEKVVAKDILFVKNKYNQKGEVAGNVIMNLTRESDGTKKFYSFIGELHEKFTKGGTYICDEIDSNFHPTLLQHLIRMFNNPLINKANAQLLFTSHDTNLMDPAIMRRDQFYFTEKSAQDETILYALSDLKGIRNNADFARQYLAGIYGALPILGNYLEESDTQN
jgi:AAA15 family ATPase/GTPase